MNSQEVEQFTLLVAGSRAGKTSFLRLLLDTSDISQANSKDQLASVAKFVQGSAGHTTHIRSTSIHIDTDNGHSLALNLIDTPTIDFADDAAAEHIISETVRLIDSRFMEGLDDERKAHSGDRFVHLCIYFLDPDLIVPPSAPRPPAPLLSRTRTDSFTEQEPVILEPPVTTNPLMFRPTLPAADIATIRRLSARVNVLPVISRADILSNDRLAAVKLAVRRDLADAGIGFGIFDMDNQSHNQPSGQPSEDSKLSVSTDPMANNGSNGYAGSGVGHLNGGSNSTASATTSPPTSPVSPSIMRLPYALVSPDAYSHSEGVPRAPPPRHELVQQYTPSPSGSRNARRGKFLRCYRWGTLDVLDPSHSDFVPLRNAIFHHMETLQKYTRDYLFEKYRSDYIQIQQQQRPPSRQSHHPHTHTHTRSHSHSHPLHPIAHLTHQHSHGHLGGLGPHASRPILAINTHSPNHSSAPPELRHVQALPSMVRHPPPHSVPVQLPSSRDLVSGNGGDGRTPASSARAGGLTSGGVVASGDSPGASASASGRAGSGRPLTTSNRTRSKKITVACNFCRSRKLKCDGGRPACGQCLKRSNPCDYAPQNKRRNTIRQQRRTEMGGSSRPGDEDDDSATGGDYPRGESGNEDGRSEVSMSPEVSTVPLLATGSISAPISRRGSNVDKRERDAGYATHHSLPPILDREREMNDLGQSARPPPQQQQHPGHTLHHITERERDHHLHMRDREREAMGPLSNVPPPPPPPSLPSHGRGMSRQMFPDNDLPHIATLSLPERSSPSTPGPMSAPTLPLLRPASEQQAAIRKRAATVPGKSGTGGRGSGSGPKVVACNSCRARKTKCDGAHPACASCSRRHVPCLYAHDTNGNSGAGRDPNGSTGTKKRRASASVHQVQHQQQHQQRQHHLLSRQGAYAGNEEGGSSGSLSPPSSRMLQTPSTAGAGNNEMMIDRHPLPHSHHLYAVYRDPGSGGRGIDHHGSEGGLDDRDRDERLSISERDRLPERDREMEIDLKRPLPLEHLDRGDLERRVVPHDHDEVGMEMRTTKKMRMEDGRPIP